jgi:catechol 2,3-dioxygenase-like lactoylglutathione lyase family enzyme
MLDHVTIGVSDIERSRNFYDLALRPLGITRLYAEGETASGYGIAPKAFFWISWRSFPQTGAHIAFTAQDRAVVDRFHAEAIAAGGKTMERPEYARITTPVTMELLSSIPTATISRQFATRGRDKLSPMRQPKR